MVQTSIRLPTQRELVQEKYPAPELACQLSDHASRVAKEGKLDAAIVAIRRAIAIAPDHPVLLSHLGAFLWDVAQYDEAEAVLKRSIEIEPNYAPSRGNLGHVLGAQGKFDEARATYLAALAIEPDFVDAKWNFAITLLDEGDWKTAWDYYDSRLICGDRRAFPSLPYPKWNGEDLAGKTLWVQGEQGCGDRILFSRYLSWVKEKWPTCRILFQNEATDLPNMANLMWAYRGIVEFVPNGTQWDKCVDYGVYLVSIPAMHGTTPDNVYPDPGLIREQGLLHKKSCNLPEPLTPGIKVGIVWSGGQAMKRNIERSVPFEVMMRLAEAPNVQLYSLQFGNNDLWNYGAEIFIRDMSRDIGPMGFCGTAAAMLNLDLVITACTASAHLAGALGVPCWTLLCANPYWVWLRDREDSVWYPNTRLFRQRTMYDWAPVFDDVRSELEEFAAVRTKQKQAA